MQKLSWAVVSLAFAAPAWAAQTTPVPDVRPVSSGWHVVINIPQQRLFLYHDGQLDKVYPVAVGKAHTQTLLGEHKIGAKAFNPTWHIPKSIQQERKDGVKTVPPGPNNPLGPVFVRLGDPKHGLGIHGTNAPASVPGVRSHGCVRMKSPDALEFANTITSGSPATVSYEIAALNVDDADNLWLSVFKDPYSKNNLNSNALKQSIAAWAKANGTTIAPARVEQIIRARAGTPVCLSCKGKAKPRIQGDLHSLAWNSGSIKLTTAKAGGSRAARDEVLPEGSSIEVDVDGDNARKPSTRTPTNTKTPASKTAPAERTPARAPAKRTPNKAVKPTSAFEETPLKPINNNNHAASAPSNPANANAVEKPLLPINKR